MPRRPKALQEEGVLAGKRALVVEGDTGTRNWVAMNLRARGAEVQAVGTCQEGLEGLAQHPDLIVLDLSLPDGGGREIAEAAQKLHPVPRVIVASGSAEVKEAILCGQLLAVRLERPFDAGQLDSALQAGDSGAEHIRRAAARAVGRLGLLEARDLVARTMMEQALGIANGSKKKAARILKVSRQALQRRKREE